MRTLAINSIKQNNVSIHKSPSFKSDISFDIGGSQREGSCKILYATSDTGSQIIKTDTTVNELGHSTFKDSEDFIDHIVKKIGSVQEEGRKKISKKGLDAEENAIRNVAIFLPSYTSDNFAYYLPNHKNIDGKPLKDLDFRNLKSRMVESGVEVAPGMRFKVMQDALGTGLAMTQRLYDEGMLTEGKYYTAIITGGGCGVANIEVPDTEKVLVKSSGSRYFVQGEDMVKVSAKGASAPAFITNFCKRMRMNDELIDEIKSCHKAEFATAEETSLPANVKTNKLGDLLEESDMFDIDRTNPEVIGIKVKDQYKNRFNDARRNAISKYCKALAGLGSIKKNEGSNGMIVTGKFAQAIDAVAKKFYGHGIADWIMGHMAQSYDAYELEKMQQAAYHFEVMCDKRFFIENNTECGRLAHLADFVNPLRGNWLKLSIKHLAK